MGCNPTSGPSAKAAHQIYDQGNQEDEAKSATTKERTTNIETTSTEEE